MSLSTDCGSEPSFYPTVPGQLVNPQHLAWEMCQSHNNLQSLQSEIAKPLPAPQSRVLIGTIGKPAPTVGTTLTNWNTDSNSNTADSAFSTIMILVFAVFVVSAITMWLSRRNSPSQHANNTPVGHHSVRTYSRVGGKHQA